MQTGEEYFQEISNLTQEIKKLAQFKDMVQHKMILPLGKRNPIKTVPNFKPVASHPWLVVF